MLRHRKKVNRHSLACVLAIGVCVYLAAKYSRMYYGAVVDDAMTSIQYARHLARGEGVVFNLGERVEGYTNFLWVLVIAPLYFVSRLFHTEFVGLVIAASIAFSALGLLLVYRISRSIWDRAFLATIAAVGLCVVDNSYTVWAALGLESHLLAVCILSAVYFARSSSPHRYLWTGLALAGAQMTRPDAALFCACLMASEFIEVPIRWFRFGRAALRSDGLMWLKTLGVWLAVYGVYYLWRYSYYGQPFPNTYYTKLAGANFNGWERGIPYVKSFFEDRGFVYLAGAGSILLVADRSVRALLTYAVTHSIYVAYVGGDFFSGHRFFVSQIPVFTLLVGATLAGLWSILCWPRLRALLERIEIPPMAFAGAATVVLLYGFETVWTLGLERGALQWEIKTWREVVRNDRRLFKWLKNHREPNAKIATGLIGTTGYFSEAYIIDAFSIIDPVTARMSVKDFGHGKPGHEKQAPRDYILNRHPDIIVPGYYWPGFWNDGYYFDSDIAPGNYAGIWRKDTLQQTGTLARDPTLSFDHGCEATWRAEGEAFKSCPSFGAGPGQAGIEGAQGGFANSFDPSLGDDATGRLVSNPFPLTGDLLVFRAGGGRLPDRLTISLWVDQRRVRITTGSDSEELSRRTWDIKEFRGQKGVIEISDQATGNWGHIIADEFAQWRAGA